MREHRFVHAKDIEVGDRLLLWDQEEWMAGGTVLQVWRQGGRVGIGTGQDEYRRRLHLLDKEAWVAIEERATS